MTAMTWVEASPNGAWLAIGQGEGGLLVWDVERGGAVARIGDAHAYVHFARWRPDGQQVAVGYASGVIELFAVDRFEVVARLDGSADGTLRGMVYHPDGALVAAGQIGDGVRVWAQDGSFRVVAREKGDARTALLVTRTHLATGWRNGDVSVWLPSNGDYEHEGNLHVSMRPIISAAISPSGTVAAFGADTGGGVWLFAPGDWEPRGAVGVPRPMAASALAFSPDNQHLAAACSDGVARIARLGPLALAPGDPELALLANVRQRKDAPSLLTYAEWLDRRGRKYEAEHVRLRAQSQTSAAARRPSPFLAQPWIAALDAPPQPPAKYDDDTVGTLKWNRDWSRDAILSGVTFAADGRHVITSQFDGTIRVYRNDLGWLPVGVLRPLPDGWTFERHGAIEAAPACNLWRRTLAGG